jgi:hypothetical protein
VTEEVIFQIETCGTCGKKVVFEHKEKSFLQVTEQIKEAIINFGSLFC